MHPIRPLWAWPGYKFLRRSQTSRESPKYRKVHDSRAISWIPQPGAGTRGISRYFPRHRNPPVVPNPENSLCHYYSLSYLICDCIFIISHLWLISHPRSTYVPQDTRTLGTCRVKSVRTRRVRLEPATPGSKTKRPVPYPNSPKARARLELSSSRQCTASSSLSLFYHISSQMRYDKK